MIQTLLQSILVSALLAAGALPRVPPIELPVLEQYAHLRDTAAPRPEDVGFVRVPEHLRPVLTAKSAIAVDLESGAVLYAKHPGRKLAIASLTKLIAALVILEDAKDLDVTAVVPADANAIEGTRSWLAVGHSYSERDLLRALLISSAADATLTLADAAGGSRDRFVQRMNEKAGSLGFTGLSFTNPVGLDAPTNFGTAEEVAALFRVVWEQPFARETLGMESFEIRSREGRATRLTSTNDLLGANGFTVLGGKTGTTDEAGQNFVTIGSVENGRPMLVVVLGSENRFKDTKTLLGWVDLAWQRP